MKGTVIEARKENGMPNPHSFVIQGEDGKEYLAHLGDIQANENLLYEHYKDKQTTSLKEGQKVEFEVFYKQGKAIHVK